MLFRRAFFIRFRFEQQLFTRPIIFVNPFCYSYMEPTKTASAVNVNLMVCQKFIFIQELMKLKIEL